MLGGVHVDAPGADRLGARHQLVLALLAGRHGRTVDDDVLIDAIWPKQPPRSARTALQTYVSELRDVLEPDRARRSAGRFIATEGRAYRLTCAAGELDLTVVEDGFDTALKAIERSGLAEIEFVAGTPAAVPASEVAALLDGALALWDTPFGELREHERLVGVAARLDERFASAVEARVALALQDGSAAHLVDALITAIEAAPYREALSGQLAIVRYRDGNRSGALDELRSLRTRLRDDLGLDPGREIVELERALLDHNASALTPTKSHKDDVAVIPAKRRWSQAPMFGRNREIDEVVAHLEQWPLVALTGPGGIGKTTIARAVLDREPEGVRLALVDLAEIASPTFETLVRSIAGALGVNEQPGASLVEALLDATSLEAALLVIDTAEVAPTIVDEVLAQLVRSTGLRVVVTSQISVSVTNALELRVDPIGRDAALQILRQDAGASIADEQLDELNDVAELLGRLPLALEIAAARVRTHGVSDTRQRLLEGVDLESRSPVRPERHHSARAAAAWGISFLDTTSKMLLTRLATHVAPSAANAIRAIWSTDELDADQIDRAVDDLCRRSLLTRIGQDGRITYRVPDPVRLAMRDQTTPDEEAAHVQRIAHVVLETAQATMFGGGTDVTLVQLEGEVPRAHDTLHEAGDMNELTLAGCCSLFWASRGRSVEGLSYMERALETHRSAPELIFRPVAGITTFVAYASGDMRRTRELLDLFQLGDRDDSTQVDMITLTVEASRAFIDRDYERAVDYFDRALVFYPNPTGPKLLLSWLAGNSRWYAGHLDDARSMYRSLRQDAIAVGEPHNESLALRFEGMLDAQTGQIERAWRLAERSASLARRLGDPGSMCQAEVALAVVAHASDSLDVADQHALEAIRLTLRPFDLFTQRTAPPIVAAAALDRDDPVRAAVALGWHDHYIETTDQPPTIAARKIADDARRRARVALGNAEFARHGGRGAGMRLAELHQYLTH